MYKLVFVLSLVSAATALHAQADGWTHDKSGVSLPGRVDDMARGTSRDLSNGASLDVMTQYGSDLEPVTVYAYRSAYPNAALWFERTRIAMKTNVGQFEEGAAPRSFVLAGSPAPNGLREEYTLPAGGPWKATAVAMAQVGEWMVKARITSTSLDKAGVAAKMDRLLAAFRFARPAATAHPLVAPVTCDREVKLKGKLVRRKDDAGTAMALVQAIVPYSQARGNRSGLAVEPDKWCRARTALPEAQVTVYRQREGAAWVALLGDAGRSIAAYSLEAFQGPVNVAVYSSDVSATRLAALYQGLPDPEKAVLQALPVAIGAAPGLGSLSTNEKEVETPARAVAPVALNGVIVRTQALASELDR